MYFDRRIGKNCSSRNIFRKYLRKTSSAYPSRRKKQVNKINIKQQNAKCL